MRNKPGKSKSLCVAVLGVTPLLLVGAGARAQSQPTPSNAAVQGDEANRRELGQFNEFLDSHQEVAEQLRRDPSLADNPQFLNSHPELQMFLQDRPEIREQLTNDPNAFMRQEDAFGRNGDRAQVVEFNRFLEAHPEIAEQLRKDPALADNSQFLKTHPALQTYLQDRPEIRQDLRRDPNAFLRQENAFDRNDVRLDFDARRAQLGEFNRFLDGHPEIAEQLRKDPSLADNPQFLKSHPVLQTYLQNQPEIRQDLRQDPNAFLRQEDAFDRDRSRDFRRDGDDRAASFHQFLGGHRDISDQLSRNPELVKDHDYVKGHPELQAYLNSRPDVREQLMNNPRGMMDSGQQFNSPSGTTGTTGSASGKTSSTTTTPAAGAASATTPTTPAPAPTKNSGTKQ
jgi:hypothetical protein